MDGMMTTFTVGSTSALNSALSNAKGGDTILLSAGDYAGINLSGLRFADAVTIKSADPSAPAVITGMKVTASNGLHFSDLVVNVTTGPTGGYAVRVDQSQDVHFDRVNFHGTLNNDPTDDGNALQFARSSNVAVRNSEFHEVKTGMNVGSTDGIEVIGNYFHDIRIDGFQGTHVTNALIAENLFTNFKHLDGDHSDAIQFWTSGRVPGESSENITIRNNVIVEGDGEVMQGIFMRDEVGNVPYINIKILDNVILGGNWNGIAVNHALGVQVSGNDLAAQTRSGANAGLPTQSRLSITNSENATVTNNQASIFNYRDTNNITQSGNSISRTIPDTTDASVRAWFSEHPDNLHGVPDTVHRTFNLSLADPQVSSPPPLLNGDILVSIYVTHYGSEWALA